MHTVVVVLIFMLAVIVSSFLARLAPVKLPLPIWQIAIGAGLSWAGFTVELQPELFFLLFIPPLLFLDGWRIPKGALFGNWKPVLMLAIGLVVFTVAGMGYFIYWLIPAVPLAVAFALAAILSPTDPVAVSAVTASSPLPPRLMHILEGESLLNDATGLVCFTFAVGAATTGVFSLQEASLSFLVVAGGGVLAGVAVTWAIGVFNRTLVRRTGEDAATQILITLLIPFAAYLVAEHFHVSGILAAAVAGIAMHYNELAGLPMAATRMQRTAVWDMVQSALNGAIFVLLGEQLPGILRQMDDVAAQAHLNVWELIGVLLVITLGLGVLRFAWVWVSLRLTVFRAKLVGRKLDMPSNRLIVLTATAGVRGAITLAGILTLPVIMPEGGPFPARDVVIFLAMGVILFSLCIASIALPIVARGVHVDIPHSDGNQELVARAATAQAAIRRLEELKVAPGNEVEVQRRAEATEHLLDVYRRRLQYGDPTGEDATSVRRMVEVERQLRLEAIRASREELYRLRRGGSINDETHNALLRELDLTEASLQERLLA